MGMETPARPVHSMLPAACRRVADPARPATPPDGLGVRDAGFAETARLLWERLEHRCQGRRLAVSHLVVRVCAATAALAGPPALPVGTWLWVTAPVSTVLRLQRVRPAERAEMAARGARLAAASAMSEALPPPDAGALAALLRVALPALAALP